jgi:hypothetical protein
MAMPSGIFPWLNVQKGLILLVKIKFHTKQRGRKACCNLRSEEKFRQRAEVSFQPLVNELYV